MYHQAAKTLDGLTRHTLEERKRDGAKRPPRKQNFVYFVQGVDGGPVKIGSTISMSSRFRNLQNGSPVLLKVLLVVPDDHYKLENALHRRFAKYRLHGEWFEDNEELTAYIDDFKGLAT